MRTDPRALAIGARHLELPDGAPAGARWYGRGSGSREMELLFYDDVDLAERIASVARSVFLAGPTRRGLGRTPWRADAIARFAGAGFDGALVIPEFRDARFEDVVARTFGAPPSPVPGMRATSHNVLAWETCGIERSTLVLFWMPFTIADDDTSLPGFTTRAEVSREMTRAPERLVLGMPAGALSSSHIRFHAHHAGLAIHETLADTVDATMSRMRP